MRSRPPTGDELRREPTRSLADYGFFVALALAGWLFYRTLRPVLVPVVVAAFVAVLVRPWYRQLLDETRGRRRFSATVTTALVVLLVVAPAGLLAYVISQQIAAGAAQLSARLSHDGVSGILHQLPLPTRWRPSPEQVQRFEQGVVGFAGRLASSLVSGVASFIVGGFLFLLSLFYFLVDGGRWYRGVERITPIRRRYVRAFAKEFESVSHALFFGTLITAVVQGAFATLGYAITRVPQPILWGAATGFFSLTPVIGTAIVWVPIALFLFMSGAYTRGIVLLLWGALVIGAIDNFLRPWLMRGRMKLHPLLVFLSVIGGITTFGLAGLLIGPLAATLFLAALRIYDSDYREQLLQGEVPDD